MRSKTEIENQLAHFRTACTAAPEVNAHWIEVLEWVLGDDEHKHAYTEWLRHIEPSNDAGDHTPRELILKYSLLCALERLR